MMRNPGGERTCRNQPVGAKSRLCRSLRIKAICTSTNMESAWIDRAIDRLCQATRFGQPTEVLSGESLVYERVGRNQVYRVARAGNPTDPVFIKVALDAADFRREVLGHAI